MGTYVRPNIYSTVNNKDLDFKRLAVVFHQNKSIGDSVNYFEEINNTELLKNVKFSSFYKTTYIFEDKIKDINFLNSDDKVLNISSTENSINNNSNIPSYGEISINNFINTIQYKFKKIDFTGNNLTNVNLNAYLNDYEISVFQINISIKMSGSEKNKPALTINVDNLATNYSKIKYINLFLNNTINGYNGVGSGSTSVPASPNNINGGNGQDGGSGGDALKITSTVDTIKIFINDSSKIIKGYGANGGVGGDRGRASRSASENPAYREEINLIDYLPFGTDASSDTHYIVYKASTDGTWRYMAVNSGYGYDIHYHISDPPITHDNWTWRILPKFITNSDNIEWPNPLTGSTEIRKVVDTHSAFREDSDPDETTHSGSGDSFNINWKMYYNIWEKTEDRPAEDFGDRPAYLYQIKRNRKYVEVGSRFLNDAQTKIVGLSGNNAIPYGHSDYNGTLTGKASDGGDNYNSAHSGTEGIKGTGGDHGTHGTAIITNTNENVLLKKDTETTYSLLI